ncbi:hypothetical protein HV436_16815, partial [Bacillus sporothermodurans]|uniref:hypothetical protein n=1 Tax=Heyndrickxia sporothermodurans TaxID=46224 RepID=UPI001DD4FAF0
YMRCLNGGLLVNYHYTRFGEVLLFLSLKPLDTQGLRIMKFIHVPCFFYICHLSSFSLPQSPKNRLLIWVGDYFSASIPY